MYCPVRYWHVNEISFVQSTGLYWRVNSLYTQRRYFRQSGNIRPVLFAAADQDVYKGAVLQLLREDIRRRRPELWATGKLFIQHGSARPHAPCSPDLSPCDCFLLPLLTPALTAHRHADSQTVQTAVTKQLCDIPASAFQDCFKDIQQSWKRCTDAGGIHFEGDPQPQSAVHRTHFCTVFPNFPGTVCTVNVACIVQFMYTRHTL